MRPVPPDRIACCVPGCGRTYKREHYNEVICGDHWRLGDRRKRSMISRVRRRGNRLGWTRGRLALFWMLWKALKAQVIERAVGISA